MSDLNATERDLLTRVLGKRVRILVSRGADGARVVLTVGGRRLSGQRAHDALSALYSRGLVEQERLNRFVLTRAGRELARLLRDSRN